MVTCDQVSANIRCHIFNERNISLRVRITIFVTARVWFPCAVSPCWIPTQVESIRDGFSINPLWHPKWKPSDPFYLILTLKLILLYLACLLHLQTSQASFQLKQRAIFNQLQNFLLLSLTFIFYHWHFKTSQKIEKKMLVECNTKQQSLNQQNVLLIKCYKLPPQNSQHMSMSQQMQRSVVFDTDDEINKNIQLIGVKENLSNKYILTFSFHNLPETIKIGYRCIKVNMYVPNPLHCLSFSDMAIMSKNVPTFLSVQNVLMSVLPMIFLWKVCPLYYMQSFTSNIFQRSFCLQERISQLFYKIYSKY